MICSASVEKVKFTDLFCGIGGMRLALEAVGCECALLFGLGQIRPSHL